MPVYTVTLRARDSSTGIRGLRLVLKRLLRQHLGAEVPLIPLKKFQITDR